MGFAYVSSLTENSYVYLTNTINPYDALLSLDVYLGEGDNASKHDVILISTYNYVISNKSVNHRGLDNIPIYFISSDPSKPNQFPGRFAMKFTASWQRLIIMASQCYHDGPFLYVDNINKVKSLPSHAIQL